jgi:decaprenylphospho-beta-D-erythro-pentofuranosid-2-ulose 2-reductase
MRQNFLIVGATSCIAEAVVRRYAAQGASFFLVARNVNKLQTLSTDLTARGAKDVQIFVMNANDSDLINQMIDTA